LEGCILVARELKIRMRKTKDYVVDLAYRSFSNELTPNIEFILRKL